MTMTNEKWADLIRANYGEITTEIKNLLWDGYGRVQHDVLIYPDGTVDTVPNIGGNDTHTNAYTVWTTRGMEYASHYDYWDESDWIGAVREVVGRDGMQDFWNRIVKDQDADDFEDYQEHVRNGYYDKVSYILTHNAAFDNIMTEIANNWKNDTENDRRESAETFVDAVIERLYEE